MTLLPKIKNSYSLTSTFVILLVTLIMGSCQKQCNSKKNNYGEPELYLSNDQLIGDEKVVRLTIETRNNQLVSLNNFRLKVTLQEEDGINSKIIYQDKDNKSHKESAADEAITHFTSLLELNAENKSFHIPFTLQPGEHVSKITANFTLFDIKKDRIVTSKSVTWCRTNKDIQLSLVELSKQLEANNKTISFKIHNAGLYETEENKLSLQLNRVLGNHAAPIGNDCLVIDPIKGIYKCPLKNLKIGGKQTTVEQQITIDPKQDKQAKFILQLFYEDFLIGTAQEASWKEKNWPLTILVSNNKTQIEGSEEVALTIVNEATESLSTDDIQIQLHSTNGVQFQLGKQTGHTIVASLTTILGTSNIVLNQGNTKAPIILQLLNDNHQANAGITLSVKNKEATQEIAAPVSLHWTKVAYPLQFTLTTPQTLVGKAKDIQLQLNHTGTSPLGKKELEDITVEVVSEHADKLKYNGAAVQGKSLWVLLGKTLTPKLPETLNFTLEPEQESEIGLMLTLRGVKDPKLLTINWAKPNVSLSLASDEQLIGSNKNVQLKVVNQGISLDQAALTDVKLQVHSTQKAQLKYNGQDVRGKSLAELITQNLNPGEEEILDLTVDSGTENHVEFKISLVNIKDPKHVTAKWTKVDIKLQLLSEEELIGGNKLVSILLTNQGPRLDQSILKKVIFQVTSPQSGKLMQDGQDVNGKSLATFINTDLESNPKGEIELEFKLDPGQATEVELSMGLQGIENPVFINNIKWHKPDIKLDLENKNHHPLIGLGDDKRKVTFKLINEEGLDLGEEDLQETILVVEAPQGGKLMKDGNDVNGQSLWEILGHTFLKDEVKKLNMLVNPEGHEAVNFTISLKGTTKDNPLTIEWHKTHVALQLSEKLQYFIGNDKSVKIDITNKGDSGLDEAELKKLVFQVHAPNGGKLLLGNGENIHGKNVWKILEKTLAASGSNSSYVFDSEDEEDTTETIKLSIDPGNQEFVNFTITLDGTFNAAPINIYWSKFDLKFILETKEHIRGSDKSVKFKVINTGSNILNKTNLQNIVFQIEAPKGGKLCKDGQNIQGRTLWDILGKSLNPGQETTIEFTVDPENKEAVEFVIGLDGIPYLKEKHIVNWTKDDIRIKLLNDDKVIIADNEALLELNNKLGTIKPSTINIELKSQKGISFTLLAPNGKELGTTANLKDLLGNDVEVLKDTPTSTFKFKLKVSLDNPQSESRTDKITITVKKGTQQFTKVVDWEWEWY